MTTDEQLEIIRQGSRDVFPEEELRAALERGAPLRVKLGVDPTAPDIHLGHTVTLSKLRAFQELGHQAVLIIGDYTARVGDPTGRVATRPPLSPEQIETFAGTYEAQVFKLLDRERTEVRRNSEWLAGLVLGDVIRLAGQLTVARMLEREDFRTRHQAGTPIGLHEFLYPLLQGFDSVAVQADVELGGTDQTFNLLVGRDLQRNAGQRGQVAVLMPLLEGLDGSQKMSKSLGNHVGIDEPPAESYGKLMSISDDLMRRYACLLSRGAGELLEGIDSGQLHPMEAKKRLAAEIVARFHGQEAAEAASRHFAARFQERKPNDPVVFRVGAGRDEVWIAHLLKDIGFAPSASAARRLAAQGAVRVDGEVVGPDFRFRPGVHRLVSVGRRRLGEILVDGDQ